MSALGIVGIVMVAGFLVLAVYFLNRGPQDKESNKREAYWARIQGK